MSWNEKTLIEFENCLASKNPTPGGGTASAVVLGQAAALCVMVCKLTIGKEKWQSGWAAAEKALLVAEEVRLSSTVLANNDSDAFDEVMASFRLPKDTEDQKILRKLKIDEATLTAAVVPHKTAKLALKLLSTMTELARFGNGNAITDIGVAALLADASCKGAIFNVQINLTSMSVDIGSEIRASLPKMLDDLSNTTYGILKIVKERIAFN